jgi:hypothetical protein
MLLLLLLMLLPWRLQQHCCGWLWQQLAVNLS